MEITINLPEPIFASISNAASKSRKRIDQVIVEKIEDSFSVDVEKLESEIALCSDAEISQLAARQLPAKQDSRFRNLLQKQGEHRLSVKEERELWSLMEISRLATLKKAFAIREMTSRDLNAKNR